MWLIAHAVWLTTRPDPTFVDTRSSCFGLAETLTATLPRNRLAMTLKSTSSPQRTNAADNPREPNAVASKFGLPKAPGRGRLANRRLVGELMDEPGLDNELHREALNGLARANLVSLSANAIVDAITSLPQPKEGRLRILDVACGGGDVTLNVARSLERRGIPAELIGCDVSSYAIEHASARYERNAKDASQVQFRQLNALTDVLPDCDVAICSLFLHHLTTTDAVSFLERLGDCAHHVLISDLRRSRLGYAMAWLVCRLLTRSKIVHVDGPLSVQAAFTLDEALLLANEAGLVNANVKLIWPERFLLQWSRPS